MYKLNKVLQEHLPFLAEPQNYSGCHLIFYGFGFLYLMEDQSCKCFIIVDVLLLNKNSLSHKLHFILLPSLIFLQWTHIKLGAMIKKLFNII